MKLFFPTMALLLLMLVAMLTFSRREASGSGAWIVYASLGDAGVNVHLMSSGSDTSRKLAPDSMCAAAPRWTPRGDRIVFESHCGNTEGYFMHILPGAARPQVLHSERAFASSIEWSHDGNAMLIESSVTDILLADADFNIERLLSNDHFRAQWSPDGQWIYAHPFYHDGTLDRIHVETGRMQTVLSAEHPVLEMH